MIVRAPYLEPSPIVADGGMQVGKLPGSIGTDALRALGHPESPIKSIRAKCLDCCGGNDAEVRKCTAVTCPLRPIRMGKNPFYGKGSATGLIPGDVQGGPGWTSKAWPTF